MRLVLLLLLPVLVLSGCDLFAPRTPETPTDISGTFLQPDTPEQVIANVQASVRELNEFNYRRSLDATLDVEPTPEALARNPSLWASWGPPQEERYFSTLASAAQFASGHDLVFTDEALSIVNEQQYVFDARYTLTVQHRRPDVPTTVRGTLIWTIQQGEDGLWRLMEWTDRSQGSAPSWSDLKAEFST